ncbi:MAG: leucine-rich repeat domain-containing protein [Alphaproteobacteria bacterium]|nr:leucine-rich repeat domain-containing protein [Alphaproteobacteria bacterium]
MMKEKILLILGKVIRRSLEFFAGAKKGDYSYFSTHAELVEQRHSEAKPKNPSNVIFGQNNSFEPKISANLKLAEIIGSRLSSRPIMTLFTSIRQSLQLFLTMMSLFFSTGESLAGEILPPTGTCGAGCSYEIIQNTDGTQNLRIYTDPNYTGTTKTIANNAFRQGDNYYTNATFNKITIDGDFDTIGNSAFCDNSAKELVFTGSITKIEEEAFYRNQFSSLTIPDSVTNIESKAFGNNGNLKTLYISDTLNDIGYTSAFSYSLNNILCKGDVEKCKNLLQYYRYKEGTIVVNLSGNVMGVTKEQCTGEKYFWNGTSCSRKEAYCDNNMYYTGIECLMRPTNPADIICEHTISGYVKIGDNCVSPENSYAKKRYTPAEANQWLYDEGNTVILTFKVNR